MISRVKSRSLSELQLGWDWAQQELLPRLVQKVVLSDVDLQKAVEEIRFEGGEVSSFVCNVAADDQVQALIAKTVDLYGRLDCAFTMPVSSSVPRILPTWQPMSTTT